MNGRSLALLLGAVAPGVAAADHSHDHHRHAAHTSDADAPGAAGAASLSVIAAQFHTREFVGDYQGIVAGGSFTLDRYAVTASLPAYRLVKNGARHHGPGDLMVHGHVAIVRREHAQIGVAVGVSTPTGSRRDGLGMGHVMAMPGLWGRGALAGLTVAASFGYGRAFGADADAHQHGAGPLVDPMNFEELTWSVDASRAVARALALGAFSNGAVSLDDGGRDRVIGGVRATWIEGRVSTRADLQLGLAGDPFNVRGVVETAVMF